MADVLVRGLKVPKNCATCNRDLAAAVNCIYTQRLVLPTEHDMNAGRHPACPIHPIPPADVRPVVRGKWENETGYIFSELTERCYCPACRSFSYFGTLTRRNFCPDCGADMREVKTNEK